MVVIFTCKHCGTVVRIEADKPPENPIECRCDNKKGLTICSGCKKKYGGKENGSETSQTVSESN